MQTDKELFEEMRNSFDLEPRPDFVKETRQILITKANKNNKLSRFKKHIRYTLTTAVALIFVIWLSFFNGTEYIASSYHSILTSLNQNKSVNSTVVSSDPTVYIYQTHSWESFIPLLNTDDPDKAFDDVKNITMVGKKIADLLEEEGISALHDNTDIMQKLENKGLEYNESYSISGEIVKNVLEKHENIKLVLDIHRDSLDRNITTTNIDEVEVPRISFVISKNNSNYEKNLKIAQLFHGIMENKYPGVSRGITMTEGPDRGLYNQDLFQNSLLIQIGGIGNTLEEEYKGAEILSNVIVDVLNKID